MYKNIIIFIISLGCLFSTAESEESGKVTLFWKTYLAGKYEEAALIGRSIGEEIPEYYFFSGLCYHNAFLYDEFELLENAYHRHRKDPIKLLSLIRQKEAEYPDHYQICLLAGITKVMLPQIELSEAKGYFEKSLALHENNPYAYNYLSLLLNGKLDYKNGIRAAEQALKLKQDFPEPYVNLAYAYTMTNEREKALSILIECMHKCPRVPTQAIESIVNLVSQEVGITIFVDKAKYMIFAPGIPDEKKRSSLIAALRKSPRHLLELAEKYLTYDNWVEAKAFLQGLTPSIEDQNFYSFLKARYHYLGGNKTDFKDTSLKLLANKPADSRHLLEIGNIYFAQGDYDTALRFFQIGVEHLDPLDINDGVQLNHNLGACHLNKENMIEGKKWIEQALILDPNDATSLFSLGIIYFKQDNKQKAKSLLLQAKTNCPKEDDKLFTKITDWLKKVD